MGITNVMAVRLDGVASTDFVKPENKLGFLLVRELEGLQLSGSGSEFVPLKTLALSPNCFSFGLSGAPAEYCRAGDKLVR